MARCPAGGGPSAWLARALAGALSVALLCAAIWAPPAAAHVLRPVHSRGPRAIAHAAVIGGRVAAGGSFPWLAYVLDFKGEEVNQCSGTVIAANLVLTAGHCGEEPETGTLDPPSGYRVVTGTTDWASESQRQVSGVSRVIVYPGFDTARLTGDAALLVLSQPTSAPPIALAGAGEQAVSAAGTEAVLAGWGKTYAQEEALTQRLRWADTVVQRAGYCERSAAPFYPGRELCAIDPPSFATGPCEGDSGGPLIAEGASGAVEIGLVSHGPVNCATTEPSVYTRVDAISSWAQEWISALSRSPVAATPSTPAPTLAPAASIPASSAPAATPSPQPAGVAPATPSPVASHRASAPADGRYRGTAGAGRRPIALLVGSHGRRLTAVAARLAYRCRSGRTVRSSVEALSNNETEPIGRRGRFVLRLAAGGERVTIRGATGSGGRLLRGTIAATARAGRCRTGRIAWTAHRTAAGHTRPGAYRGRTEQGRTVAVRVAPSGRRLVRLRFTALYRCPGHRRMRLTRTLLSPRSSSVLEAPGSFTVKLTGARARGRVDGAFGLLGGGAFGTLRASVRTSRGRCVTGLVGWQARR